MSKTIESRVTQIIVAQLGLKHDEVTPEKHIEDDLGADSLDMIEMIMAAEEEFEMDISDNDAEQVKTVQQAIDLITRLSA